MEFSRLNHHLLRSALCKPWMRSTILSSIRSFSSRPSTAFSCGCGNASMQFSRRGLTTKQHQLLNIVQKQYNGLTVEGRRSLATLAKTLVSQPNLARTSNRGLLHQLTRGMAIKIKLSPKAAKEEKYLNSVLYYAFAIVIFMVGMSYAGVPLYRMFCAASGSGSQTAGEDALVDHGDVLEKIEKVENRVITVRFNSDTASSMQWNFRPQQTEVKVAPGETALAFYKAMNPTDDPITGISTYNVIPYEAGPYFNKIQCFCFEEQRLNPHEEVDMPVFFYIDAEYAEDPKLEHVDEIMLSYTFFESKEGMEVPLPNYMQMEK